LFERIPPARGDIAAVAVYEASCGVVQESNSQWGNLGPDKSGGGPGQGTQALP